MLEKYHRNFIRSGAALNPEQKEKLRAINKELGLAELAFGQNVLAETNAYKKFVTNKEELKGLPESNGSGSSRRRKRSRKRWSWLFTTQKSSFIPVLQYAENRELRKEPGDGFNTSRCNHGNANDNKAVINKIMKLRVQKAQLLGFETLPPLFWMTRWPKHLKQFITFY